MPNTKQIERKWLDNFKKSPLVDKETGTFNNNYAKQLFYGKQEDTYPADYPHDFSKFLSTCNNIDRDSVIDQLLEFLEFVGIKIKKVNIQNHLEKFPNDYSKLTNKSRYIFKELAHCDSTLNINNPYRNNSGDIFFLSRIESEESVTGGQLNLFEDIELPVLYKKLSNIPNGYDKDSIAMDLFRRIENSNESFFITGKAGTGKSTFIHYFAQNTQKKVLMTSFTGIAAINVGGQTIHSFFRFPLKPLLPEDHEITMFQEYSQKYKIIEKIDTIVIDEVSTLLESGQGIIIPAHSPNYIKPNGRFKMISTVIKSGYES